MAVSPEQQAAARTIWRKWLREREEGKPYPLTMKQVAVWLGVKYHRVKTLRDARWRVDTAEARRLGVDPPPYIPLRTALCREWFGTTYDAWELEKWVVWARRRNPRTGDIRHGQSPGRPASSPE